MSASATATSQVRDGVIWGKLSPRVEKCARCFKRTRVITLEEIVLPEGVTLMSTILQDNLARLEGEPKLIANVGIGCGCYAKFHRQICHIRGG